MYYIVHDDFYLHISRTLSSYFFRLIWLNIQIVPFTFQGHFSHHIFSSINGTKTNDIVIEQLFLDHASVRWYMYTYMLSVN